MLFFSHEVYLFSKSTLFYRCLTMNFAIFFSKTCRTSSKFCKE
ncbi:hypothetical protein PNI0006_01156 [Streptococcus pneumoniae PNI0006]|nr:hypothetical protein PNI0006_01156 [Streptococcus pneumoniae PNI0006]